MEEIIRFTYREYPFYATRSEIAQDLLTEEKLKMVELARPAQKQTGGVIYHRVRGDNG